MAYMKSPKYSGDLTLNVGRGDMKVEPGVKYRDTRLARFVGMGMMIEVPDDDKAPTVAAAGETLPAPSKDEAKAKAKAKAEAEAKEAEAKAAADAADAAEVEPSKDDQAAAAAASPDGGSVSKSPANKTKSGGKSTSTKK